MGFLVSLLVLSFLIFFHELGHFLAARFFGVRVERFSIGFGKVLFSKKYGDTEYLFSAVPLGGYVQMKGQDDSDPTKRSTDSDSYSIKKPYQKIIILMAGAFANFLLAFIIYYFMAISGIDYLAPKIGEVDKNSPAYEVGLQKGDEILLIDGVMIERWDDVSPNITNKSLQLLIERNSTKHQLYVTPKMLSTKTIFGEDIKRLIIGIKPLGEVITIEYDAFEALGVALERTYAMSKLILLSIQKMIEGIISIDNIGGIISIVDVTSKASEVGLVALFSLMALISVNLGVLNLLPIPALDGGHILFTLYTWISGKEINSNIMYKITLFGWALLLALMLLGIYNDINRLMGD